MEKESIYNDIYLAGIQAKIEAKLETIEHFQKKIYAKICCDDNINSANKEYEKFYKKEYKELLDHNLNLIKEKK